MKQAIHSLLTLFLLFTCTLEAQLREVRHQTSVPLTQAIRDAMTVAEKDSDWSVMLGDGGSMSPYFGPGSVVMVDKAPYYKLQPDMIVVFRDAEGDLVGHWLVRKEAEGWHTQGVNNSTEDTQLMDESMYVGVIFGLLHSAGPDAEGLAMADSLNLPRVIGKLK